MSALKNNLTKSLKLNKIKKKKHLTLGPTESTHHLPSLVHHRGSGRRRARQNPRSSNHHERCLLISDPNFVKTHLHRPETRTRGDFRTSRQQWVFVDHLHKRRVQVVQRHENDVVHGSWEPHFRWENMFEDLDETAMQGRVIFFFFLIYIYIYIHQ